MSTPHNTETVQGSEHLKTLIASVLDEHKAEDIDYMIVATGRSNRQVVGLADKVSEKIKSAGYMAPRVEGLPHGDWVIVDAYDIILHVFRPEVREFYNIEKMWRPEPAFQPATGTTRPAART